MLISSAAAKAAAQEDCLTRVKLNLFILLGLQERVGSAGKVSPSATTTLPNGISSADPGKNEIFPAPPRKNVVSMDLFAAARVVEAR